MAVHESSAATPLDDLDREARTSTSGSPELPRTGGLPTARRAGRDATRANLRGTSPDELRGAQRDVILQRTVVLIWISVVVMPTTIWSFVYFTARPYLELSVWIV